MRSNAEVLVQTTATDLLLTANAAKPRRFVAIANHGPNPIYVTIDGSAPALGKGLRINATSQVVLELPPEASLKAIAGTANQATGAATSTSEW